MDRSWNDLRDRIESRGLLDQFRCARAVQEIGTTWFIDGYSEQDWCRLKLGVIKPTDKDVVQPRPTGPTTHGTVVIW